MYEICYTNKLDLTCDECQDNFYLNINDCTSISGVVALENCIKGQSASVCLKCDSGYYLDGGNCIEHDPIDANCDTVSSDSNTCNICTTGYYFDGNKCVP